MMNYRKAENVEQELTKSDLPFEHCLASNQKDFLWMQVNGGTKLSNVIGYAQSALEKGEYRSVVWSGSGGGVIKVVSCAEVFKRSLSLYQISRMSYKNVEEHWKPITEGLEDIVVKRQIPMLHILQSLDPFPESVENVQNPNTLSDFWRFEDQLSANGNKPNAGRGKKRTRPERSHKPQQPQGEQSQQQQQQREAASQSVIDSGHG
ncbi:ribonuclease P protein subunit p25-like protein [Drosophila sulfurigaster albostrigata]|uniref:ribonuclease P protein subunit p25-like protein n=1 Tax=Drosophila sulfurigaster albostrigata TaxID=89887 RepID=UPI002D21C422|nr:ribonuclease P protein subunit p25-like protein [Drosophila sulfurigaster albostrigata]